MILAMMGCLTVIVVTGIMQLTNQFFGVVWVETVHHWAANVVIWLVPLHVLGVIVSSWMHQENLVGAMLTGDKSVDLDGAGPREPVPSEHEQVMTRLHANQGFTVLAFLLAGGLFIGWTVTSHRTETAVVETPPVQAVAESTTALATAIQGNAVSLMKDKQDIATGGPESVSQAWLVSSGGRLYDNWFAALGVAGPTTTHPAWPAANTSLTGDQTWRCKNCHGWDYMGRDGISRSSQLATGIIGIQRLRGRDPAAIVAILGNATHGYTDEILPPHAKQRLALFVARGQHTASQYVLPDGRVKGRADLGQPYFQSICASCHGFDGRARKLGASGPNGPPGYKGQPLYVGSKANSGPVEVLHKIRNGHPGAIMVSLRSLPMETAANILAYAQTLPTQ